MDTSIFGGIFARVAALTVFAAGASIIYNATFALFGNEVAVPALAYSVLAMLDNPR